MTPAYSWKVGKGHDNEINLTVPLERIDIQGLNTYRAGTILQFVHPFELPGEIIWKLGPDINYSFLGSMDLKLFPFDCQNLQICFKPYKLPKEATNKGPFICPYCLKSTRENQDSGGI